MSMGPCEIHKPNVAYTFRCASRFDEDEDEADVNVDMDVDVDDDGNNLSQERGSPIFTSNCRHRRKRLLFQK